MKKQIHFQLLILTILFAISPKANSAQEVTCANKNITIVGHYGNSGESVSPLLEVWSAESGNLKKLETKSQVSFYKIELDFYDVSNKSLLKKEWILTKKMTPPFDFIADFKSTLAETSKVKVNLYEKKINNSNPYCTSTFSVLKVDGEGPL